MKKKKSSNYSHGDLVVDKAVEGAAGGLPKDEVVSAIRDAVDGMKALAKRFKEGGHQEVKASEIPRAMSYLAKTVDEVIRLTSFLQGGPDSRVELQASAAERVALDSLLASFSNEQLAQMRKWRKENEEHGKTKQV